MPVIKLAQTQRASSPSVSCIAVCVQTYKARTVQAMSQHIYPLGVRHAPMTMEV